MLCFSCSVRERIVKCLKEKDFKQAIRLLTAALEAFPSSALFGPTETVLTEDSTTDEAHELSKADNFAYRFKVIFVGECRSFN